ATFDLTYTRSDVSVGSITQTVTGLPNGATMVFTPATAVFAPATATSATSQLVVTTLSTTPDNTYPLTITTTSGSISHTSPVSLVVARPPDFALSLSANALTVARGSSGQVSATIQTTGSPGGVTIIVDGLTSGVTAVASPAVVSGSGTTLITFTVSATATPGPLSLTVRGITPTITRSAPLSLTIPAPPPSNLVVHALSSSVTMLAGGLQQVPVRITRTGAAVGQLIDLTAGGMTGNGAAWITPALTTGDSVTLNILAGSAGTSTVIVSGVISSVQNAIPSTDVVAVTAQASLVPDFAFIPAPQTISLDVVTPQQMAIEIRRSNGFTGPISFETVGPTASSFSVTFALNNVTGNATGMTVRTNANLATGPYVLRIRGTSGAIVRELTMTIIIKEYTYPPYPGGSVMKTKPPE
ncbi:MAG: hypothetical protein ABJB66_00430, partial [Gemmatimonadaceae bacterium]